MYVKFSLLLPYVILSFTIRTLLGGTYPQIFTRIDQNCSTKYFTNPYFWYRRQNLWYTQDLLGLSLALYPIVP
jgi:hypothetical protein